MDINGINKRIVLSLKARGVNLYYRLINVNNGIGYRFPRLHSKFLVSTGLYRIIVCSDGTNLFKSFAECCEIFLNESEKSDKKIRRDILSDLLVCFFLYGANPEEYFLHGFRNKNAEQRSKYVLKALKDKTIMKQLGENMNQAFIELKDKYQFYKLTKKYFKRDVCQLKKNADLEPFHKFVLKHKRFIAKPIQGRYGKNTNIYDIGDFPSVNELSEELLSASNEWVIEELIDQDERMKSWNPTSVNTIRIPSFRTKEGFKILIPFLRMGRKGSIVDNAGSGGIMVPLNNQGIICGDAMDENGNIYIKNPDNGKPFHNWRCPEWEKLIKLAHDVHESLPSYHKYVGFDFALSTNGWVLVEGNWGDFICQQATLHRGIKEEFMELMNS